MPLLTNTDVVQVISEVLYNCEFCSDDEVSIKFLYQQTIDFYGEDFDFFDKYAFECMYTLINTIHPDRLLPYEFYLHPKLCSISVYLIHERLKMKKLKINKRNFHELCYYAKSNEKNPKFKSLTHVCNSAVKIYESGSWHTPDGFEDLISWYKEKIYQTK